jgi:hypothetical protein
MATLLISFGGSVVGGIVSSLLTIYLAPRARHLFWSRERITELRLATYDKVNGITAAIYMHESADSILGNMRSFQESPLSPMGELLASLMTAHDEIKNRFSETALQAYKKLERLLESRGLPSANRVSYAAARAAVLEQLHTESLDS